MKALLVLVVAAVLAIAALAQGDLGYRTGWGRGYRAACDSVSWARHDEIDTVVINIGRIGVQNDSTSWYLVGGTRVFLRWEAAR